MRGHRLISSTRKGVLIIIKLIFRSSQQISRCSQSLIYLDVEGPRVGSHKAAPPDPDSSLWLTDPARLITLLYWGRQCGHASASFKVAAPLQPPPMQRGPGSPMCDYQEGCSEGPPLGLTFLWIRGHQLGDTIGDSIVGEFVSVP